MRILTVTHFYESHGGGIERVAGQLCRQFNDLGATALWAASDGDELPTGIEAVPLPCVDPTEKLTGLPMPVPGLRGYRALARAIEQSDAVVIHDALYVTSILAMLIAKRRGKRVIMIQHIAGIPFSSRALRAVMKLANRLVTAPMLRNADARVFISDTVRQDLLGGNRSLTSELLFNGVDQAIFHPRMEPQSAPRSVREVGRVASRKILFVGRYVEKKGLSVLRELARSRPDFSFFLAGSGPINPPGWGLSNVHDLGPRRQEELADLYRWADLLLLPSVGEGYPLVIQEAMACGLPVVCGEPSNRADPDAAEWITGVKIELSDPVGSAKRCAEAIDKLRAERNTRAMSEYAAARYSWRRTAERLLVMANG